MYNFYAIFFSYVKDYKAYTRSVYWIRSKKMYIFTI